MKSLRFLDRRVGSSLAAVGMLLGMVAPAVVPALASADVLTSRSIALSSSVADAASTTYQIKFTTTGAAGAAIVDFCGGSPIPGQTCGALAGFSVSGASVSSSTPSATFTAVSATQAKFVATMGAAANVTIDLAAVHNPTAVGTFYARIVTYVASADADDYTSTDLDDNTVDQGGVALATTNAIGISASVRESLTFCVAGGTAEITDNCANASANAPNLVLGEDDGSGSVALSSSAVSEGDIYTQLSTNAAGGAVVRMKSNATGCGGLVRQGAVSNNCNIAPITTAGTIANTTAQFGVKVAAGTDTGNAFGTVAASGDYDASDYYMNYVSGDASGVTSTYGDPIFASTGAAANRNMKLTFGASAAPQTPAGNYKATLNLIATGTY